MATTTCMNLGEYIESLDQLLACLRLRLSEGQTVSVDEMVEYFLAGTSGDLVVDCHALAVTLALTMQKLVLGGVPI